MYVIHALIRALAPVSARTVKTPVPVCQSARSSETSSERRRPQPYSTARTAASRLPAGAPSAAYASNSPRSSPVVTARQVERSRALLQRLRRRRRLSPWLWSRPSLVHLPQLVEEVGNDFPGRVVAAGRLVVPHAFDAVPVEQGIARVVLGCAGVEGLAIDFKHAPTAVVADKEVWFAVGAAVTVAVEACHAVRHKEHTSLVERVSDAHLGR